MHIYRPQMDCSKVSYRDTLRSILSSAQLVKSSIRASARMECSANAAALASPLLPPPEINLPIPKGISQNLFDELGSQLSTANSLSDLFLKAAYKLRAAHLAAYQSLSHHLSSDTEKYPLKLANAASHLEYQYQSQLKIARKLIIEEARRQHMSTKRKPTFNVEFTPLLEEYFDHNAYPSAADRSVLARKSMMTPRQIEVWFQNHRNRAKKEGKPLHRLDPDAKILNLSLDSLGKKMPLFVVPTSEAEEHTRPVTEEFSEEPDDEPEPLKEPVPEPDYYIATIAPPHAFPAPFSPPSSYAPLQRENGQCAFPHPVWRRLPASCRPSCPTIDFDQFVEDFKSKLTIRDLALKKQRPQQTCAGSPWFAGTRIVAPRAPHPALIRLPSPPKHPIPAPFPSRPASQPQKRPLKSPSPYSEPATLASVRCDRMYTQRRIAGLPKRAPKHPCIPQQLPGRVSAMCFKASSPSQISPVESPLSSFGHNTGTSSHERRYPSSSSSSSCSSSENLLLTPTSLETLLPEHRHSSPSEFTSSFGIDKLLGDDNDEDICLSIQLLDGSAKTASV